MGPTAFGITTESLYYLLWVTKAAMGEIEDWSLDLRADSFKQ